MKTTPSARTTIVGIELFNSACTLPKGTGIASKDFRRAAQRVKAGNVDPLAKDRPMAGWNTGACYAP